MSALGPSPLKASLRRAALAGRDAIPAAYRLAASHAIAQKALPLLLARGRSSVAGYCPIRSEVDPGPLMQCLFRHGAELALPVVLDEAVTFRRWSIGDPLVKAGFGTLGPGEAAPEVFPSVILLPLAAFDRSGRRIGYGKGHYDRAVVRLRTAGHCPWLVGLSFAAQEVSEVPAEDHDVALHIVVTETGVIKPGS